MKFYCIVTIGQDTDIQRKNLLLVREKEAQWGNGAKWVIVIIAPKKRRRRAKFEMFPLIGR